MFSPFNTNTPKGLIGPITKVPEKFPPQLSPCSCLDCPECSKQYRTFEEQKEDVALTYEECVSSSKAAEIAINFARQIEKDREYISTQLAIKGVGIVKKWKGKSIKSRELLLRKVNPAMYDKNWCEGHFAYEFRYSHYGVQMRMDQEKYRNICLLPYISVESLKANPSRLMRLLYNRTKYSPEDWVSYDSRMLNFPWTVGCFDLRFNKSCVVMHGAKYGQVVPWEQEAAHRWDIVGFPRGVLILEAQAQLMKVLSGMTEALVNGLDDDPVGGLSLNQRFDSKQLNAVDSANATYCINETFALSPNFDMATLSSIAQTRLHMAEDHVWELQTNPAYMRRYVNLNMEGELSNGPEAKAYGFVVMDIDFDLWTARHWNWIVQEVNDLDHIRSKFRDCINPGEPLPPAYNKKLGSLEILLAYLLDI
jgi:hypothetical protein